MKLFSNIVRQSAQILLVFAFSSLVTLAQTTAFTYQGRLNDTSTAANGSFDFQFTLYDAAAGGNQQGSTQTITAVNVADGVFSVQLDFGSAPFAAGANRFLEIRVKKPAEANYTTLTPRQRITSVPYAIRSLSAASADNAANLNGQPANQFVLTNDPRLSEARPPAAGSNFYIQNQNAAPQIANFNINGTGRANIFDATTQYNINGQRVLRAPGIANVFAGVNAGPANTQGIGNSFVGNLAGSSTIGNRNSFFGSNSGVSNTTGFNNSFFGGDAGARTNTGANNSFFGTNAGTSNITGENNTIIGAFAGVDEADLSYATAIGAGAFVSTSNTIVLGRDSGLDIVQIPGRMRLISYGAGGTAVLCRNTNLEISSCSSSLRYKNNIAPFNFGLNLVKRLKPITFNWKDGGMADLGLGAEDVAAIEPLLVTYNKDGQVEGVKYDRIGVILINAVKEQQAQIAEQLRQLEEQRALIDALRQLVCSQNSNAAVCKEKRDDQ